MREYLYFRFLGLKVQVEHRSTDIFQHVFFFLNYFKAGLPWAVHWLKVHIHNVGAMGSVSHRGRPHLAVPKEKKYFKAFRKEELCLERLSCISNSC